MDGWRVTLAVEEDIAATAHPEGCTFLYLTHARTVLVTSAGTSGVMYGTLRLAELIRHDLIRSNSGNTTTALARVGNLSVVAPLLMNRGLKISPKLDTELDTELEPRGLKMKRPTGCPFLR